MSHVTVSKEKVSDLVLFVSIAAKLGYGVKMDTTVQMYGSNRIENATSVHITGWNYPLAIDKEGHIHYDHFGSGYNTMEKFHELMCTYNEEVTVRNIPMEEVQGYYLQTNDQGERQLVMNYE